MQVEVQVRSTSSGSDAESLVRPVRALPDRTAAGVVIRRQVYPLYRERTGERRYYVRLDDRTYEKSKCPLLNPNIVLDWSNEGERVRPSYSTSQQVGQASLEWRAESNAFGLYIFLKGGRVELNRALQQLHVAGYRYSRVGTLGSPTGGESTYDWCIRVDSESSAEELSDRFRAALDTPPLAQASSADRPEQDQIVLRDTVSSLQVRLEASEKLVAAMREQLRVAQQTQHDRARASKELREQLKAEKERGAVLMQELDAASMSVRRLATAEETVERLRRNLARVQSQLRQAQQDSATSAERPRDAAAPTSGEIGAASARLKVAELEVSRLLEEQSVIQQRVADAEADRDNSRAAANESRQALELLKLEVEDAIKTAEHHAESTDAAEVGIDVLDAEVTDLRSKIADLQVQLTNLQAMREAEISAPIVVDDEAADEAESKISRATAAAQLLKALVRYAFPRLSLSEPSFEQILDKELHTEDLWRELHALDSPGDLLRGFNRIGNSDWRELNKHINERTRVYWKPHEGRCRVHVWWKLNDIAQQRLHETLVRNPNYGF